MNKTREEIEDLLKLLKTYKANFFFPVVGEIENKDESYLMKIYHDYSNFYIDWNGNISNFFDFDTNSTIIKYLNENHLN